MSKEEHIEQTKKLIREAESEIAMFSKGKYADQNRVKLARILLETSQRKLKDLKSEI